MAPGRTWKRFTIQQLSFLLLFLIVVEIFWYYKHVGLSIARSQGKGLQMTCNESSRAITYHSKNLITDIRIIEKCTIHIVYMCFVFFFHFQQSEMEQSLWVYILGMWIKVTAVLFSVSFHLMFIWKKTQNC